MATGTADSHLDDEQERRTGLLLLTDAGVFAGVPTLSLRTILESAAAAGIDCCNR